MKKSKLIFCFAFIFVVLLSCTFPCLCASWGELHPNSSPQYTIPLNPNFDKGIDNNNYTAIVEIVKNAYDIGLFGGSVPLYITMDIYTNGNPSPIYVHFANPTIPTSGGNKYSGLDISVNTSNQILTRFYTTETSFVTANIQTWTLTENGEFGRVTGGMSTITQLSATGRKLLSYYDDGVWKRGSELVSSSFAVNVYSIGELVDETLSDIISSLPARQLSPAV